MSHPRLLFLPAAIGIVLTVIAACGNGDISHAQPAAEPERKRVLAPIDAAELLIRESMPVEYAVQITSGLPSGCAVFEAIDQVRDGRHIELAVWNTVPADEDIACTMIYGTAHNTVELGTDFEPGESYVVSINETTTLTFTGR